MDNAPLVEKIKALMAEHKIPGVAVGILNGDETFTAGFGVTNVDHPLEVDDQTLFQIGSITKTFVGTLGMRLAEMGKIDLDVPIRTYLPDFKVPDEDAASKATIRHLFTHTAGWVGDWFPDDLDHGDIGVAQYVDTMAEDPQLTPVGTVISYNNAGYNLAGRIYEVVLGKPFSTIAQEMLFDPLDMKHTYLLPWEVMTHRFASGHMPGDDGPKVARPWSIGRASGPAGGIITCVTDMLHYARFQLGDGTYNGERLLSKESLDALHTPQVQFSPVDSVCLTFWADDSRGIRTIRHGGGTVGQISQFVLVPEHNFGIILVTNSASGGALNTDVVNFALTHYLGIETPEAELLQKSTEELAAFAGKYEAALSGVELSVQDGELVAVMHPKGGFPARKNRPEVLKPSAPSRMGFWAEDNLVGLDGPFKAGRAQFVRNDDGSIAWLRFGSRIQRPIK